MVAFFCQSTLRILIASLPSLGPSKNSGTAVIHQIGYRGALVAPQLEMENAFIR